MTLMLAFNKGFEQPVVEEGCESVSLKDARLEIARHNQKRYETACRQERFHYTEPEYLLLDTPYGRYVAYIIEGGGGGRVSADGVGDYCTAYINYKILAEVTA